MSKSLDIETEYLDEYPEWKDSNIVLMEVEG